MSIWQKRANISAIIWVIATSGFLIAGLSGDGPAGLEDDTPRRNIAGASVAFGLLAHMGVRYLTRHRQGSSETTVDERDQEINRKASETSLAVTVVGLFLGCIALGDSYQAAGAVPVNWLWFLGYSGFIISHLGWALSSVLLYSGVGARAQG